MYVPKWSTNAIKSLQTILGVEADGIYGPKTEAALLKVLEEND